MLYPLIKGLIVLASLLLLPGGSNPGKSQSPTGSSSTSVDPVASYASNASTCALTAASLASLLSLTCLSVQTLRLLRISSYFHCWFCLHSLLNRFIRFLFLNYEKKFAPRWRMHQWLCRSCHGVCSSGPGFDNVLIALSTQHACHEGCTHSAYHARLLFSTAWRTMSKSQCSRFSQKQMQVGRLDFGHLDQWLWGSDPCTCEWEKFHLHIVENMP